MSGGSVEDPLLCGVCGGIEGHSLRKDPLSWRTNLGSPSPAHPWGDSPPTFVFGGTPWIAEQEGLTSSRNTCRSHVHGPASPAGKGLVEAGGRGGEFAWGSTGLLEKSCSQERSLVRRGSRLGDVKGGGWKEGGAHPEKVCRGESRGKGPWLAETGTGLGELMGALAESRRGPGRGVRGCKPSSGEWDPWSSTRRPCWGGQGDACGGRRRSGVAGLLQQVWLGKEGGKKKNQPFGTRQGCSLELVACLPRPAAVQLCRRRQRWKCALRDGTGCSVFLPLGHWDHELSRAVR